MTFVVLTAAAGCSESGDGTVVVEDDRSSDGVPLDASGAAALEARRFHFAVRDLGLPSELAALCGGTTYGALDLDRRLAFYFTEDEQSPTLIVGDDQVFVASSALDGWNVDSQWLVLDAGDREGLGSVAASTGVRLVEDYWETVDTAPPVDLMAALEGTVESSTDEGADTVRGVDTTRYRLMLDDDFSIRLGGGDPTASGTPSTTAPTEDAYRAYREQLYEVLGEGSDNEYFFDPAYREAFIDGDIDAMADHIERDAGEGMSEHEQEMASALLNGDIEALEAAGELSDEVLDVFSTLVDVYLYGDIEAGFGAILDAAVESTAKVWVDDDGVMRRFRYVVEFTSLDEQLEPSDDEENPPFVDLTIEMWGIGDPLEYEMPADAVTTRVEDLPAGAIPSISRGCRTARTGPH